MTEAAPAARPPAPAPALAPAPEELVEVEVGLPGGGSFRLVLPAGGDDPVVAHYRAGEAVNDHLVNCLRDALPHPGVVVDLGCHVGTFSMAAAALGHRVVAVDASARHADLVARSARANGVEDRVAVVHRAVADAARAVAFSDRGLFGAVDPAAPAPGAGPGGVAADTVPALLAELGLTVADVDLLKVDVEGSELRALAGMAAELARRPAPMVLYESNPLTAVPFGYGVEGLRTALAVLGYTSYRIELDGLHPCPPTEPQPEAWVDLLALHHGHHPGAPRHGPWSRDRLLERFDLWSRVPEEICRIHLARTLLTHWDTLGDHPRAQEIVLRLAADEHPDVRHTVDRFRWAGPAAVPPAAGEPAPAAPPARPWPRRRRP